MAYLGAELAKLGMPVDYAVTIKDDPEAIYSALAQVWGNYEVVITTGGLGPTEDDLSKASIAGFFGKELHFEPEVWEHVQSLFSRRKMATPEINRCQAMVPDGFTALKNERGTAPGLHYCQDYRHFFALQGVPLEMRYIFATHIVPILQNSFPNAKAIYQKTLRTHGISESRLAGLYKLSDLPKDVSLAWLPQTGRVDLRFYGSNRQQVDLAISQADKVLAEYVWAGTDESPAEVLLRLLWKNSNSISVAESCTGGLVQKLITDITGASKAFLGGIIAYTNEIKENVLKVDKNTLERYGAVSEQCAAQMAKGIKALTKSRYAVSVTGIAGPDGGTAEKPVGTVCFGFIAAEKLWTKTQIFTGDRDSIRLKAAEFSILELIKFEQGRNI